jgi:hypothetical protein
MVALPNNQLLLLAEGGQCSLHKLVPDGPPEQLAHVMLHASEDSDSMVMGPYGSVISCNTLFGSVVGDAAAASLLAISYVPGMLHFIKAAHQLQESPAAAASCSAASAAAGYSLTAKGMPFRHAVLSCSFPGETLH